MIATSGWGGCLVVFACAECGAVVTAGWRFLTTLVRSTAMTCSPASWSQGRTRWTLKTAGLAAVVASRLRPGERPSVREPVLVHVRPRSSCRPGRPKVLFGVTFDGNLVETGTGPYRLA